MRHQWTEAQFPQQTSRSAQRTSILLLPLDPSRKGRLMERETRRSILAPQPGLPGVSDCCHAEGLVRGCGPGRGRVPTSSGGSGANPAPPGLSFLSKLSEAQGSLSKRKTQAPPPTPPPSSLAPAEARAEPCQPWGGAARRRVSLASTLLRPHVSLGLSLGFRALSLLHAWVEKIKFQVNVK